MLTIKSKRIHYAWFICAGCTLLLFCTGGLSLTAFAAYLPYLTSLKGLAGAQISAVVFVRSLFGVIGMLLVNKALEYFEVRRVVAVSLVGCGVSFVIFGSVSSFPGYLTAAAVAGISYGFGSMIAVSILISRWFVSHRGLALGITMSSTGLSTFIVSPIITAMVENLSLRASFYIESVFVFLSALAVWILIRSTPSCLNMQPLESAHPERKKENNSQSFANRTAPAPLFFVMGVGLLFLGAAANNISNHLSVLYQSVGYTSYQLSMIISLFGLSLAIGKFVYGELADLIGVFKACLVLFAIALLGSGMCCLAGSGNYGIACTASVLAGFGMSLASVATSTYAVEVAAEQDYPRVVSVFQTTQTAGGLAFATVPGILADFTGNYVLAYVIMFLFILFSAVILQTAYMIIKIKDRQNLPEKAKA